MRTDPSLPISTRLRLYSRPAIGGCRVWIGGKNRDGYGQMWDGRKSDGAKLRRAHRLAWVEENGAIPDGMQVLHSCDNPSCIRVKHLFLGTHADNMADKIAKGRGARGAALSAVLPKGEQHKSSKLTVADVIEIRRSSGFMYEIAAKFGISTQHVCSIKHRQKWSWLP